MALPDYLARPATASSNDELQLTEFHSEPGEEHTAVPCLHSRNLRPKVILLTSNQVRISVECTEKQREEPHTQNYPSLNPQAGLGPASAFLSIPFPKAPWTTQISKPSSGEGYLGGRVTL